MLMVELGIIGIDRGWLVVEIWVGMVIVVVVVVFGIWGIVCGMMGLVNWCGMTIRIRWGCGGGLGGGFVL
jgi:hypothetical protein